MSSSRKLITQVWRRIVPSRCFVGVMRLREEEDSVCNGFRSRGYVTGNRKLGSKYETNDVRDVESGCSKSQGYAAFGNGHRNFESSGQFGSIRNSEYQNHGGQGRKTKMSGRGVNVKRNRGFKDGFRMPEFDPGNDQLKKIFESQMDINDPIGELDLGEVGTIEGNFRDDDDSEAEDFYKNA